MQGLSYETASPQRVARAMDVDRARTDWVQIADSGQSLLAASMRRLESLFISEDQGTSGEPSRVRTRRWN